MTAPAVRAKHLQQWLRLSETLPARKKTAFDEAIPAATREAIDAAPALAWLPIEYDVQMADALALTQGPAGAHAFYAQMFRSQANASLLAPLARLGGRLMGETPNAFVKWLPKGFAALFRACGTVTPAFPGPQRARLVYEGIPPMCAASPAWVESLASGVDPIFAYTRVTGVVRVDRSDLPAGRIVLDLEWSART